MGKLNRYDYASAIPQLEGMVEEVNESKSPLKHKHKKEDITDFQHTHQASEVIGRLQLEIEEVSADKSVPSGASTFYINPYTTDHPSTEWVAVGIVGFDLDGSGISNSRILAWRIKNDQVIMQIVNDNSSTKTWTLNQDILYKKL